MSAISRNLVHFAPVLLFLCCTSANADVINFEDLPDAYFFSGGDQNIGNFFSGITFGPDVTGLSVSRFGGYASDAFPPHSADVVVWDAADPTITISFTSSVQSFGVWYTSFDPLTLAAFGPGNNLLGTIIGGPNTDGSTGTTSLLMFSNPAIQYITLTGSPGLFTLDDVTTQTTPEPSTLFSVAFAIAALVLVHRMGLASSAPPGAHAKRSALGEL